jgi:3-oxoadipate enol-lactonase
VRAILFAAAFAAMVSVNHTASASVRSVAGNQLYVTDEGAGEPVLLLHGGFMDSTMWDGTAQVLRAHYRVVRFDLRGYGQSPASRSNYSPATDIAAVLDHLGIERAHLVGISMGGGIAIDFAVAHPSRVRTLILAEPGLSGWQWSADVTGTMQAVMEANRDQGRAAAIHAFLRQPVFASAARNPAALAAIREQLERNFNLESKFMVQFPAPALEQIHVPTLVMTADRGGPDAQKIATLLGQQIAGAQVVVVKDSGHMINFEAPLQFYRLLAEFLAKH